MSNWNCFAGKYKLLFRNLSSSYVNLIKVFNTNEFIIILYERKLITES
jgi:hypothetical protein